MPFIHPDAMKTSERLPGWHGRYWRSESMSFARYTIDAGSAIHEHHHPHEEVWIVLAGASGAAIVANHPVRHEFL